MVTDNNRKVLDIVEANKDSWPTITIPKDEFEKLRADIKFPKNCKRIQTMVQSNGMKTAKLITIIPGD